MELYTDAYTIEILASRAEFANIAFYANPHAKNAINRKTKTSEVTLLAVLRADVGFFKEIIENESTNASRSVLNAHLGTFGNHFDAFLKLTLNEFLELHATNKIPVIIMSNLDYRMTTEQQLQQDFKLFLQLPEYFKTIP